jgi:hypothetical protein
VYVRIKVTAIGLKEDFKAAAAELVVVWRCMPLIAGPAQCSQIGARRRQMGMPIAVSKMPTSAASSPQMPRIKDIGIGIAANQILIISPVQPAVPQHLVHD